uniref:Uncharacterized protein n=1 Tax=Oryza meridionalis TaxID=40149 RepID=A0A0E0CW10_9ORYZ
MLLESQVYLAQCKNATWARSTTSRGDTVEVSFCVDKPPAVSYMCVHSPTLTPADFTGVPSVVCSEEDLLLLLMPMAFSGKFSGKVDKEYFMYKAGSGSVHPSLRRIPTHHQRYHRSEDIGMIRDGGEYYLAALLFTSHIEFGDARRRLQLGVVLLRKVAAKLYNSRHSWRLQMLRLECCKS